LLGDRVPAALKAFLLSVAIFDDLGAIVVITVFYTTELSALSLIVAGVPVLALFCLNRLGVNRPAAYILLGIPLWIAVLKSGVHATLAGVVLAMFIPLRAGDEAEEQTAPGSLLRRLEHALHPWVAFGVLPLFAFANAGVALGGPSVQDTAQPVPLGVMTGLFLGKQIGIVGLCWVATRVGLASLPDAVGWRQLHATAALCGIGFTMSLFIESLAFESADGNVAELARLGILLGTFASGVIGYLALRLASPAHHGPSAQLRN